MGASVLPVTVHNGKVLLLFGKERNIDSNPGWSDFGGGTDKGETFMETAARLQHISVPHFSYGL